MKRWLALASVMAVAALAACSSPSGLAPSGQAPQTASFAGPRTGTPAGPPNETPAGPHTATLDAAGRPGATLDVLTGTAELRIGTADFGAGGALLRVSTPAGDPPPYLRESTADPGQDPVVSLAAPGASLVTVTLNTAVDWRLALGGGTTHTIADLRGGRVTGIAFTAGSSVISVALPRPRRRVPVQLAGGASQFLLSLPSGVPARVTVGGGASEVSLGGQDHVGVAGGSVFTTPGWPGSAAGFDIDATAGADRVAVTTRSS